MTPTAIAIRPERTSDVSYGPYVVGSSWTSAKEGAISGGELVPSGVVFSIPRSQAYFWTVPWQIGEAEADADIQAGRVKRYTTAAEAIRALRADDE